MKNLILVFFTSLIFSEAIYAIEYQKVLRTSCGDGSNFSVAFQSNSKAIIELGLYQIHILSKVKKNEKKADEFTLISPYDMGSGGFFFKWDQFSKKKPIMTIIEESENKYLALWYGFYDKLKKNYTLNGDDVALIREGKKGHIKNSYILYLCEKDKAKKELKTVNLRSNGIEKKSDFIVVYQMANGKKKLKAYLNSKNKILELMKEFSPSTIISNLQFFELKQTLVALFIASDNKWTVKYCWDISNKDLFYAANKIGLHKIYHSKNINSNSQCTSLIKD